jgi:hypothetical protein
MTIEAWTTHGSHGVSIVVHEFEEDDDTKYYTPELIFFLEPPKEEGVEDKVFCILTDIYHEDVKIAVRMAAEGLLHMFDEITNVVSVYNDGEEIDQLSLDDIMNEGGE